MDFITIGSKIKSRRKALGITQETIAGILDVNASHICNIECGRAHPSLTVLVRIANILHCSVDCFLNEEYTYNTNQTDSQSIDEQIINKLKFCDTEKKLKINKIIDIL